MSGKVLVGISGWRYEPWRGVFYPAGLAQHRELEYASGQFPTIEINGTFYSLQYPYCFEAWRAATPPGFVFAIKGSRFITHMKKLRDVEKPLANFFASGIFALGDKIGPFLWQFPPNFRFNADLLEAFFELLPRDTASALSLARRRDGRVKGRARLAIDANRKLRHAIEIRHESFVDPAFVKLLRKHRIALVVADTAGKWPFVEDVTADFMYLRLHGDKELYASGYGDEALDRWATRIRAWRDGAELSDARKIAPGLVPPPRKSRDVYCYFDNDMKVKAPHDAKRLIGKVAAAALLAIVSGPVAGDDALWRRIASEENIVVLTRHTQSVGTNPLAWDETGACRGEHVLTAQGRLDAAALGRRFRERAIRPVIVSSPMCRCLETARIAFGEASVEPALREIASGDAARTREFEQAATRLLKARRGRAPIVFVSHRPNIDQLTLELIDDGELVVGKVDADGRVDVLGKIREPK